MQAMAHINQLAVHEVMHAMKMWNYCILVSRGVSPHCGQAKKYHKAKEELWRREYFTMQKYNLQKILQNLITL